MARVRINTPRATARAFLPPMAAVGTRLSSSLPLSRPAAPAGTPSRAPTPTEQAAAAWAAEAAPAVAPDFLALPAGRPNEEASAARAAEAVPAAGPDLPPLAAGRSGERAGPPAAARLAAEDLVAALGPGVSDLQRLARLDAQFSGSAPRPELSLALAAARGGLGEPRLRRPPAGPRGPRPVSRPIGSPGAQRGRAAVPALGSLLSAAGLAVLAGAAGTAVLASVFSVASVALALGGGYIFIMGGLLDQKEEGWAAVLALPYLGGAAYAVIKASDALSPIFERLVSLSDLALIGAAAVLPLAFAAGRRLASRFARDSDGMWPLGAMWAAVGVALGLAGAVNVALGLLPSTHVLEALGSAAAGSPLQAGPHSRARRLAPRLRLGVWAASGLPERWDFLSEACRGAKPGTAGVSTARRAGMGLSRPSPRPASDRGFRRGRAAAWILIGSGLLKPAWRRPWRWRGATAAPVKALGKRFSDDGNIRRKHEQGENEGGGRAVHRDAGGAGVGSAGQGQKGKKERSKPYSPGRKSLLRA